MRVAAAALAGIRPARRQAYPARRSAGGSGEADQRFRPRAARRADRLCCCLAQSGAGAAAAGGGRGDLFLCSGDCRNRRRRLAYREQQQANRERDRAEQTLAAATATANGLVFDLAQRFRDTIGIPAALVKDILDRALALQDQLTKSGQVTPDLKHSKASALDETASTLLAIGDTAGAMAAAQQANKSTRNSSPPIRAMSCGNARCRSPTA